MSLTFSLIYQNFIAIGGLFGKREQTSFFNKINFPMEYVFKHTYQMRYVEQRYFGIIIISDKYVNIAFLCRFAA